MIPTHLVIAALKQTAVSHYTAFEAIADNHDCGRELLKEISIDAASHALAFNRAMDELATLDPRCPKDRL